MEILILRTVTIPGWLTTGNKMYIFNIGLSKGGTTSLTKALNILGIPSLHYEYKGKKLQNIILKNTHKNRKPFYKLDQSYKGYSDFNGEWFITALYKHYPNSKFIFLNRDFNSWLESRNYMFTYKLDPKKHKEGIANTTKENYEKRINTVYEFFQDKPKSIFLEMNIIEGDGWEKLCNFLEIKKIPNIPFPHEHKR